MLLLHFCSFNLRLYATLSCELVNIYSRKLNGGPHVCFGSQAAAHHRISLMAAIGRKAVVPVHLSDMNRRPLVAEPGSSIARFFRALNAHYRRKRTIKARPDLTLSVISDADYDS